MLPSLQGSPSVSSTGVPAQHTTLLKETVCLFQKNSTSPQGPQGNLEEAVKMSESGKDDAVRFSLELSAGEREASGNRMGQVRSYLQSLGIACNEETMPNIAVLGSGGGLRAMIALLGTLAEMQKQGLLDAVMYLCGVSGSTWCMSTLYNENNWAKNIEGLEKELCEKLSKDTCHIREEFRLLKQAAEDELFSLTDVWDTFFVYSVLKLHDPTKLSQHNDASTKGTNPYPIYAAVEYSKLSKEGKTSSGPWFEYTPHESGLSGLGAFVSTKALGSKFHGGTLREQKEEKHIGYLQGLWGSAPGNMKENIHFLLDLIKKKFQSLKKTRKHAHFAAAPHSPSDHCEGAGLLLELYKQGSAGENCEEVFRELKQVLKVKKTKNSYLKCSQVHEAWKFKTWEERKAEFTALIKDFKTDLQATHSSSGHCWGVVLFLELHMQDSAGKDCEGVFRELMETHREGIRNHHLMSCDLASFPYWKIVTEGFWEIAHFIWECEQEAAGFIWSVANLLWKMARCLCTWTWGTTPNFLYGSDKAHVTGLTNKLIYLIDAGLCNNSAYPLVLRQKRNVKLILSFDFSSGDPFETIRRASEYCQANRIPFPPVDPQVIKDQDKPSSCYIFSGTDTPTVMHFPLFNTENCPGANEIQQCRDKFATIRPCYAKEDIEELLTKAKKNVSNNLDKILKEIKQIMSSPTPK
ncbi:cytosolic phospholipase A2 gamma-like isoform X2 [Pelodiscus sinensis]|uniref:cytosolic phospholipase A2 gamma-like isoform X2 n=1 Tax=Pelodiscus sinensis TaxID=13735 RepID=UPI003F6B0713